MDERFIEFVLQELAELQQTDTINAGIYQAAPFSHYLERITERWNNFKTTPPPTD